MEIKTPIEASITPDPKRALSVSEFCKRYAIGRSTAYGEHKRGRLAFKKVGARSIILASEAERWAASLPEAHK